MFHKSHLPCPQGGRTFREHSPKKQDSTPVLDANCCSRVFKCQPDEGWNWNEPPTWKLPFKNWNLTFQKCTVISALKPPDNGHEYQFGGKVRKLIWHVAFIVPILRAHIFADFPDRVGPSEFYQQVTGNTGKHQWPGTWEYEMSRNSDVSWTSMNNTPLKKKCAFQTSIFWISV